MNEHTLRCSACGSERLSGDATILRCESCNAGVNADPPPDHVTLRIESAYEDTTLIRYVVLPGPTGDEDDWWEDVVWPETGDGNHPGDPSWYEARVIAHNGILPSAETREWD